MIDEKILHFDTEIATAEVAKFLLKKIQSVIIDNDSANILLAGGESILKVYLALGKLEGFKKLININFYCGDERLCSIGTIRNNFDNISNSLFKFGVPKKCFFHRIPCENGFGSECIEYENQLPKVFDLLIFSMGHDGHIASIFPGDLLVCNSKKLIAQTTIDVPGGIRVGVTPELISFGKSIYTYIEGRVKIDTFYQYMDINIPPEFMPIKYLNKGFFILSK
jgi:6-phosphogluconolactonase